MPVSLKTEQIITLKILQKWQTQGIPIKVAPTLLFCFHVYSVKNKQITVKVVDITQWVKYFPCKHEDLGSTPSSHERFSHGHSHL